MTLPKLPEQYTLIRRLGDSALSEVFLIADESGHRFALKLLRLSISKDPRILERFRREAELLEDLRHPNLVQGYGTLEVDGRPGLLLEFIEGASLRDALDVGPLGWEQVARYGVQVSRALHRLHRNGVLHRDVKPHNVLLDPRRGAILADLGLVRREEDPELTRPGSALGSPAYMSPEQAKDPSGVSSQADVYSLGATLHHALSGQPPFRGKGVGEVIHRVLHMPPEKLPLTVPDPLVRVLDVAMAKDPDRRYPSVREFGSDLGRVLLGYSPKFVTGHSRRKHQIWGFTAAGILVLGSGLTWWWQVAHHPSLSEQERGTSRLNTAEVKVMPPPVKANQPSSPVAQPGGAVIAWLSSYHDSFHFAFSESRFRKAAQELVLFRRADLPSGVNHDFALAERAKFLSQADLLLRSRSNEILVETSLVIQELADRALANLEKGSFEGKRWTQESEVTLRSRVPLSLELPIFAGDESVTGLLRSYQLDLERRERQFWKQRAEDLIPAISLVVEDFLLLGDLSQAATKWKFVPDKLLEFSLEGHYYTQRLESLLQARLQLARWMEKYLGSTVVLSLLDEKVSGRVLLPKFSGGPWLLEDQAGRRWPVSVFQLNPEELPSDWGLSEDESAWLKGQLFWAQGKTSTAIWHYRDLASGTWRGLGDPWWWANRWETEINSALSEPMTVAENFGTQKPNSSPAEVSKLADEWHAMEEDIEQWIPEGMIRMKPAKNRLSVLWETPVAEPRWSPSFPFNSRKFQVAEWNLQWESTSAEPFPERVTIFSNIRIDAKDGELNLTVAGKKFSGFQIMKGVQQELRWNGSVLLLDGLEICPWRYPGRNRVSPRLSSSSRFQPISFEVEMSTRDSS